MVDLRAVHDLADLIRTHVLTVPDTEPYGDEGSFQAVPSDLNVSAGVGTSAVGDSSFIAAIMGNILGAALTKTHNYLAGLIGAYSISGAKATTYPAGGVLGIISDGVTVADGALVAVVDGDSALTKATAAFKAMMNNSTPGSGFEFGLDLFGAAHDGYLELAILKADLRFSKEVCMFSKAGVPTDGIAGDGAGFAEIGSVAIDRTNGNLYVNAGTKASPTWKLVTRAA